jgi:sugar phosphate permease
VFVNVGYLTWMPTLLHRKFDLSVTYAGLAALSFHHAFAFVGVVLGGRISDLLARRRRIVRMEFEYLGLLLAAPFIYLMGAASQFWLCCLGLSVFGLFRGVYDSNLFAAPFEVIPARLRSSALGVMLSFAFLMGAFAPIVLARLAKNLGLDGAVASLAVVYVASAVLVVVAAYTTFQRDAERASGTNNVD